MERDFLQRQRGGVTVARRLLGKGSRLEGLGEAARSPLTPGGPSMGGGRGSQARWVWRRPSE